MSLADFNDIYWICCEWNKSILHEDVVKLRADKLLVDAATDTPFTRSSSWWEMAKIEILHEKERESVLL